MHRSTQRVDIRLLAKRTAGVVRRSIIDWPIRNPKPTDWTIWNKAVMENIHKFEVNDMGEWICTHQRWPMMASQPQSVKLIWIRDPLWKATLSIGDTRLDTYTMHDGVTSGVVSSTSATTYVIT